MREGQLSRILRPLAIVGGSGLIAISVYWSKTGFSFDLAGNSFDVQIVAAIGYSLAVICTLTQFVFATNIRDLNPTLIVFGLIAYAYSIYSNYLGIIHFQGTDPDKFGSTLLAFIVDGLAEPLIAWGMYASLEGDLLGNLIGAMTGNVRSDNPRQQHQQRRDPQHGDPRPRPDPSPHIHDFFGRR